MRTILAVVLGLSLTTGCVADDAKKELDRLQGDWQTVRAEAAGKVIPVDGIPNRDYILKGDELIPTKNPKDPGKLTLDPSKKPAWIDLTDRDNKTMPGIYRVDGDRWEICFGDVGGTRPTEFKTEAGTKSYLMVLQRKKK